MVTPYLGKRKSSDVIRSDGEVDNNKQDSIPEQPEQPEQLQDIREEKPTDFS